jgi:hypothetical protein
MVGKMLVQMGVSYYYYFSMRGCALVSLLL